MNEAKIKDAERNVGPSGERAVAESSKSTSTLSLPHINVLG